MSDGYCDESAKGRPACVTQCALCAGARFVEFVTAPAEDRVALARENVVMCYHPATFSEEEFLDRLDALIAAVCEQVRAEVRQTVEGMQRWDTVDIDGIEWNIGHDSEGEYLYRSDVLRRLAAIADGTTEGR